MLDLHGWGDLQPELNTLSKRGDWEGMGKLIDDQVLEAFAIVASPADVGPRVQDRYVDLIDRFSFYLPYALDDATSAASLAGFRPPR